MLVDFMFKHDAAKHRTSLPSKQKPVTQVELSIMPKINSSLAIHLANSKLGAWRPGTFFSTGVQRQKSHFIV